MLLYNRELYSDTERSLLEPFFTNLEGPVFALTNLPEVVKAAIFARYSRSPKSLRRLFLDEFVLDPDIGISSLVGLRSDQFGLLNTSKADALYRRIFSEFGDDSVAQLGSCHLACEQASNLLTKVLEWSRLGAYLEQSTRYIRYDLPLDGQYRYYTPFEITDAGLKDGYHALMTQTFELYTTIANRATEHFKTIYAQGEVSDLVWQNTLKAKACDVARSLLPVATKSNVGVYANGQVYESMIIRMRALSLIEPKDYAEKMLIELDKVIPSFMARVNEPLKGIAATQYLIDRDRCVKSYIESYLDTEVDTTTGRWSVELIRWSDLDETTVHESILFPYTHASLDGGLFDYVDGVSDEQLNELLTCHTGIRNNRRHKPGRAFESVDYEFEIISDYGCFRDLQRHRMLTIDWQRLNIHHGYAVDPLIDEIGLGDDVRRHLDRVTAYHARLTDRYGEEVGQYVLPFCTKLRYRLKLNARELYHLVELRTGKGGHTTYRNICQAMVAEIRQKTDHQPILNRMEFFDDTPEYDLPRLDSETRADLRGSSQCWLRSSTG